MAESPAILTLYQKAKLANESDPQVIARREKKFWISWTAHFQECYDIRAEERADGIRPEHSVVKRYYGEEGNFAPHDWQIEKINALVTPEQLREIIGPYELDRLTQRMANWLISFLENGEHLI